jgi:hypothetical protein
MAKKQVPIAGHDEGQRLTPEEAAALVDTWTMPFLCDDETIGDFLLLIYSIVYEQDMTERETLMIAIENTVMPYAPFIGAAVHKLMSKRLAVAHSLVKEGGTQ